MEVKVISGSGENGEQAESHPEVWLAVQGFLVAFLWEMLQMPFYVMDGMTARAVTKSCALASLGDAGIMVGAAWIADRLTGGGLWHERLSSLPAAIFLGIGLAVTAAIEWLALRSEWGWSYAQTMPIIFGIGVVPLAMWVVVPLVSLGLARKMT
ncbi:hypothetical protein H0274_00270 [Altererythrobacter sp. CC-YST694]|jgi:hypothetical protein|uniref:hypothetical protein n=1 Tax=Altererythrobacter sp. CC-YST694 TaxID=2755038 RepID=UPI000CAA307A|nr:hypothetical protein [Altererythrobacter sp. CC-YST694]MCB5423675.1 hypothetical protein [Altererythrobacter sp. CC-YST694]PKQ01164.1 MAG: hypothetical protein CVT74_00680 [Alphaproteobacteria bacterium HGW-Alphaproteobacteria-13]